MPEGAQRNTILRIRLTRAEREKLDRVAGADTSTWAREILLREAASQGSEDG